MSDNLEGNAKQCTENVITDRIKQKKSRKIVVMNTKSTKNVDKST